MKDTKEEYGSGEECETENDSTSNRAKEFGHTYSRRERNEKEAVHTYSRHERSEKEAAQQ